MAGRASEVREQRAELPDAEQAAGGAAGATAENVAQNAAQNGAQNAAQHAAGGASVLARAARAVLFVDMVESVRLIEANEEATIRRWLDFLERLEARTLPRFSGRIVKKLGDGLLAAFEDVADAVAAAFEIQRLNDALNERAGAQGQIALRMGLNTGEVVVGPDDLYGRHVNIAARLMTLAEPGEIVTTRTVRDLLVNQLDADFEDLGDCYLRHLAAPVRAFRVHPPGRHPAVRPLLGEVKLLPTLAVVPFLPRVRERDPFSLGEILAEDMIVSLARSPDLNVISRLSSSVFRLRKAPLTEIGEALQADFLLSGTYSQRGDRLVLDVELAEVRTGEVVWANRYVDSVAGLLDDEQRLIHDIGAGVRRAVLRREVQIAKSRRLPTLESYTLLLGAIELMHRGPSDFEMSRRLLQAVLERAPRQPLPLAWMAKWHVLRVQQGWSDDCGRDAVLAQQCTARALDADPENALVLVMDGSVHTTLLRRLDIAERRYDAALEASPNEPLGRLLRGTLYAFRGEGQAAIAETERARLLTPLDPHRYYYDTLAASACISAENHARALQLAEQSLRANRTHTSTWRVKAVAEHRLGRREAAARSVRELLALEPGFTVRTWLDRAPAAAFPVGRAFAETLRAAGVPET